MLKSETDSSKQDYEQQLKDLRRKYQDQVDELTLELHAAQTKAEDSRERELVRRFQREADEYKQKWSDAQKDLLNLRSENERLKTSRDGLEQERQKMLEHEQETALAHEAETSQLADKVKQTGEDQAAEIEKAAARDSQLQRLTGENEGLKQQVQDLELEIGNYKQQLADLGSTLKDRETEIESCIAQIQEENKEKAQAEQEEKQALQAEIDRLSASLQESDNAHKDELTSFAERIETAEKEKQALNSEQQTLRVKLNELQTNYEGVKNSYAKTFNQKEKTEDELTSLQSKYRNTLERVQELAVAKDHLELSLRMVEEEQQRLAEEKAQWSTERGQLQQQISVLVRKMETLTKDSAEQIRKCIKKASEYKAKVRQGNLKLQQMTARLVRAQAAGGAESFREPLPNTSRSLAAADVEPPFSDVAVQRELLNATPEANQLEEEIAKTLMEQNGRDPVPDACL